MTDTNIQNGIIYQIRQKYGIVCDTDSYKLSHHIQYVPGATRMISYIESRGGDYDVVMNFGLQLIIKEYFLQRLTQSQADNMIEWAKEHLSQNMTDDLKIAFDVVINEYDGKLPIIIKNAPEGLMIPVKNVLATIETSTPDPRIFSLVSYFETKLLRVWSPMTTGTKSWHLRKIIKRGLDITSDIPDIILPIMMWDFGSRGTHGMEHAAFTGASHLVSFTGSDTTVAMMAVELGYNERMAAHSIPASEHSTTTSRGINGEVSLVQAMFDSYGKEGSIFTTVIDSYDAIDFLRTITPEFKQQLIDKNIFKWVLRPDTNHPVYMPLQVVEELDKVFGHTTNSKGFKVLNNVGVIQGDGIGPIDVQNIINELIQRGWCCSNISFGMGGNLLTNQTRDSLKFSMKCCAIEVNGEWLDVYKDPAVYDDNWVKLPEHSFKKSKRGVLELVQDDTGKIYTIEHADQGIPDNCIPLLQIVYKDGELVRDMTFDQVRTNAGTN